jgi:ZIP family zinc transporter
MASPEGLGETHMTYAYGMAILLTSLAGLSTGVGSLLGIVTRPGPRFMSASLGFAAGIMILISFVELLPDAIETLGFLQAHLAFFAGMFFAFILDVSVPHIYMAEGAGENQHATNAKRTGVLLALGIGIHNFPEGMATFAGTLKDVDVGIAMAVAIAAHNIPEGLAVAAPIYAATGSRRQAFLFSLLSGIAEPVGAAVAAVILFPILTPTLLAWIMGAIGGVMVFISLDELAPASKQYGHEHLSIIASILGMAVMALSLHLLG